ncbi:Rha family transcriptional regulator [Campylobacter fetus]|uniref:Rha family transcriptional regulator n=1 Tax=Campylobacter fetus TaxID=196 RepID=UPI00122FDFDE|nr:Rha family transcriptional regulator [Campylobacter fetus]KAA3682716.1 hypothetical protein E3G72_09675 [Campylobacter fetus subsp. fetus]
MSSVVLINNQEVSFEVVGDQTYTTSRDVAQVFEKEHKNIIAQIEALPNDEFRQLNFQPSSQPRLNGLFVKDTKFYNLTRDGFSLLVMGFTGEKAYQWKVEFINAFNKMEAMIKSGGIANEKFTEVITALSEKSAEANEFKQKYYEGLERENELLRVVLEDSKSKIGTKLSPNEKANIIKLYKSGLSQAEICRQTSRSDTAVKNAIRSAL